MHSYHRTNVQHHIICRGFNISKFQFDRMQDLAENHFRASGASWVNIIIMRMRKVMATPRGRCKRVSTLLLAFFHEIKGMLTSNKRHKVSSYSDPCNPLNRLIDTIIMTYQKYDAKMKHFFVLPCGTCEAFGLLCIAILCSAPSNFCFETIFHSLIPLC